MTDHLKVYDTKEGVISTKNFAIMQIHNHLTTSFIGLIFQLTFICLLSAKFGIKGMVLYPKIGVYILDRRAFT